MIAIGPIARDEPMIEPIWPIERVGTTDPDPREEQRDAPPPPRVRSRRRRTAPAGHLDVYC